MLRATLSLLSFVLAGNFLFTPHHWQHKREIVTGARRSR
jgi:hypothetical protein